MGVRRAKTGTILPSIRFGSLGLAPSASAAIPLWERPSKRGGRDPLIMLGGGGGSGCRIHSGLQSGTNTREEERLFTCGEAD